MTFNWCYCLCLSLLLIHFSPDTVFEDCPHFCLLHTLPLSTPFYLFCEGRPVASDTKTPQWISSHSTTDGLVGERCWCVRTQAQSLASTSRAVQKVSCTCSHFWHCSTPPFFLSRCQRTSTHRQFKEMVNIRVREATNPGVVLPKWLIQESS